MSILKERKTSNGIPPQTLSSAYFFSDEGGNIFLVDRRESI
ncbi:hypothetical protein ISN44_As05g039230 [Arabidopsis suecica]|uniref:Uncharacterized protein n=1 Tax=Arabidopsis suecica TaxID=45249 RepID=A0A8T2DKE1_ARASU|nr:hypothetical protein ISN44_As05g039230 [Arabidopsis suecica]